MEEFSHVNEMSLTLQSLLLWSTIFCGLLIPKIFNDYLKEMFSSNLLNQPEHSQKTLDNSICEDLAPYIISIQNKAYFYA